MDARVDRPDARGERRRRPPPRRAAWRRPTAARHRSWRACRATRSAAAAACLRAATSWSPRATRVRPRRGEARAGAGSDLAVRAGPRRVAAQRATCSSRASASTPKRPCASASCIGCRRPGCRGRPCTDFLAAARKRYGSQSAWPAAACQPRSRSAPGRLRAGGEAQEGTRLRERRWPAWAAS